MYFYHIFTEHLQIINIDETDFKEHIKSYISNWSSQSISFEEFLIYVNEKFKLVKEDCYLIEREKYSKMNRKKELSLNKLKDIIKEDDSGNIGNWDIIESYDLNKLIDMLDDGFGINNLKKNNE